MTSDYSSESIRELYERNFDTLYRVCYMYMKNIQDTEDAVHNAFLKAIETRKQFESENHEKAWLIRVASNICKNMLKAACRKNEPLNDNIPDSNISNEAKELLSELSKLPDKLKIPVYLFYYDGYSSEEIGQMLHISSSAVRTRLQKARERLMILTVFSARISRFRVKCLTCSIMQLTSQTNISFFPTAMRR